MATFEDLLDDRTVRAKLFVVLRKAIIAEFTKNDWRDLAGIYELHLNARILKGAEWRDNPDYPDLVHNLLVGLWSRQSEALPALVLHDKLRPALEAEIPEVVAAASGMPHVAVVEPEAESTREVVMRALRDAETLIRSGGAESAVDRLHTALHGYLGHACTAAGLTYSDSATVGDLFKLLRIAHPAFIKDGPHSKEIDKLCRGLAQVLDSLGRLRNQASMAHPTVALLTRIDAELTLNAARTVFNYIAATID